MQMTIIQKGMSNKAVTINNAVNIPRVGDHIDMGFEPVSKVIRVLWSKFPDFDDVFVIVD